MIRRRAARQHSSRNQRVTARSDGSTLRVWTESVNGWIARSAELLRADGAAITVEPTNQVGYRTSPLLRQADQWPTLPHHGPTRRHRHQRALVTAVIAPSRSARRRLSPDSLVRQDDHTRGSHRTSLASGSRVGPVCHCRTAEWNDVDLRGYTTGTHESRKRPYPISPYQRMPASKFGTCKH